MKGQKWPNNKLLSKLWDYIFDFLYQQGTKMFVSDALPQLHIEEEGIHDVIPSNILSHLNIAYIYHIYEHLAYTWKWSKTSSVNDHKTKERIPP